MAKYLGIYKLGYVTRVTPTGPYGYIARLPVFTSTDRQTDLPRSNNVNVILTYFVLPSGVIKNDMKTRSVAAGFGRHGMPPPTSNDTGTAFCFPN